MSLSAGLMAALGTFFYYQYDQIYTAHYWETHDEANPEHVT